MRAQVAVHAELPRDQAHGLRRLFAGVRPRATIALAANPHVPFTAPVLDQLARALAGAQRRVLVLDAADGAPAPSELAALDLAAAVVPLGPALDYLAARGLPRAWVDTRGSSARLLDAALDAAPRADVLLVHAGASDLARMFQRRAARPLLVCGDDPESLKHAYASLKLLALRCGLLSFDLVLAAAPGGARLPRIASSLADCADAFIGATLHGWAVVDPAASALAPPPDGLVALARAQLALGDDAARRPETAGAAGRAAAPPIGWRTAGEPVPAAARLG